jgi:hypothetical protein
MEYIQTDASITVHIKDVLSCILLFCITWILYSFLSILFLKCRPSWMLILHLGDPFIFLSRFLCFLLHYVRVMSVCTYTSSVKHSMKFIEIWYWGSA